MTKAVRDCDSWDEARQVAPPGCGLAGWVSQAERERLFHLAKSMRPEHLFVEIGIYGADNLQLFALASPDGARIVGIDDWSNDTHWKNNGELLETLARRNIEASGHADKVELIGESSHVVGPTWDRPIDILRVDGDHTPDGAYQDLVDFAKWVKPGGVLLVDNYSDMDTVRIGYDRWLAEQPGGEWVVTHEYADPAEGSILTLQRKPAS